MTELARQGQTAKQEVSLRHEEDGELVRQAYRGATQARAALVGRLACVPAMLRAKHTRMGSPLSLEELADVEQNTFAAIWDKLDTFQGRSRLETWVWSFCVLELLKGIGSKARRAEPVGEVEPLLPVASLANARELPAAFEYETLYASLAGLGSPASDVIRLKHFDELTFDQIALRLNVPINTAKTWYYRGLRSLRELLVPTFRKEV